MLQRGGNRDIFKRGAETSSRLGRNPGTQACAHRQDAAALLTKTLRGSTEGMGGPDPTQLTSRGQSRVENSPKPPVREQQAWVWNGGAECLRFAQVSQSLSQTGEHNTPTRGIMALAKWGGQAQEFPADVYISSGERRKAPVPGTECYTAPQALIYQTQQSGENRDR